jgi:transposase
VASQAEKVALYAAIRRDSKAGMSGRALEHKYGVTRRTVAKALASVWPEPRKKLPPRKTRLDPFRPVIDAMLRADLDAPRKQRHTVRRIFDRLVDEHDAAGVSYPMVRADVAWRRPEIRVEAGRGPPKAFVPQSHQPGVEAEVDFGEVTVRLAGEQVKLVLFAFRDNLKAAVAQVLGFTRARVETTRWAAFRSHMGSRRRAG